MLDIDTAMPPHALIRVLEKSGLIDGPPDWKRLTGGRTNRLWRFRSDDRTLVCKLYSNNAATPLFPNDIMAEALALQSLRGTGLAPTFCARLSYANGDTLIYEYVAPSGTPSSHADIAQLLARLHGQTPPQGLRNLNVGERNLVEQGDAMLRRISDPRTHLLQKYRPKPLRLAPSDPSYLHGDPVPANVVSTLAGPCLIDWQCPAIGDATEDLAIYLSPAMQHLYGGAPLSNADIVAFLSAYGDKERAQRYRALAPAYHWRMAAYCLWKAASGDTDYFKGFELELARLKNQP